MPKSFFCCEDATGGMPDFKGQSLVSARRSLKTDARYGKGFCHLVQKFYIAHHIPMEEENWRTWKCLKVVLSYSVHCVNSPQHPKTFNILVLKVLQPVVRWIVRHRKTETEGAI